MKRCAAAAMVFFLCSVCSLAGAAEYRLAYVSIQKAVTESDAGNDALEQFKGEADRLREELEREKEEIIKLGEVLDKQSMMLTDEVRREKEKDYLKRKRDYERQVEDSKTDIQIKEAELTNDILEDLIPVIQKYGKENGYDIIFEKNDRTLLYITDALDLTDEIIKIYNMQYQNRKKQ